MMLSRLTKIIRKLIKNKIIMILRTMKKKKNTQKIKKKKQKIKKKKQKIKKNKKTIKQIKRIKNKQKIIQI